MLSFQEILFCFQNSILTLDIPTGNLSFTEHCMEIVFLYATAQSVIANVMDKSEQILFLLVNNATV